MQTIVTDVRGIRLSVCPSVSLSVTRALNPVQPLPNHFGLFTVEIHLQNIYRSHFSFKVISGQSQKAAVRRFVLPRIQI